MRLIIPKTITDADIVSSNLVEDLVAHPGLSEYSATTTYALDAYVFVAATKTIYQSLQASNLNKYPPDNISSTTPPWKKIGPLNTWAMFDQRTLTQSVGSTDDIVIKLNAKSCDAIFFANLDATSIDLVLRDGSGSIREQKSVSLTTRPPVANWWQFLYNRIFTKSNTFVSFGKRWDSTLEITIKNSNAEDKAACGIIVLGEIWTLGRTQYGCSISFKDYSTVDTDDFGNTTIVNRHKASHLECDIYSFDEDVSLDELNRVLAEVQSVPTVWDFNNANLMEARTNHESLQCYGFSSGTEITPEQLTLRTARIKVTALL